MKNPDDLRLNFRKLRKNDEPLPPPYPPCEPKKEVFGMMFICVCTELRTTPKCTIFMKFIISFNNI